MKRDPEATQPSLRLSVGTPRSRRPGLCLHASRDGELTPPSSNLSQDRSGAPPSRRPSLRLPDSGETKASGPPDPSTAIPTISPHRCMVVVTNRPGPGLRTPCRQAQRVDESLPFLSPGFSRCRKAGGRSEQTRCQTAHQGDREASELRPDGRGEGRGGAEGCRGAARQGGAGGGRAAAPGSLGGRREGRPLGAVGEGHAGRPESQGAPR